MELTIALVISILSIVFTILNFAFGRKDKSNSNTKDEGYRWGQIDAKLQNIEEFMAKIEKKLDSYDSEIDDRIEKAIRTHIKEYHDKGK
jgi:archaellum component FlaC